MSQDETEYEVMDVEDVQFLKQHSQELELKMDTLLTRIAKDIIKAALAALEGK